jgi:hypothetical protein
VTVERFASLNLLASTERLATADRLITAHMVYFGDPSDRSPLALLQRLSEHAILVVGDGPGFAAAGGMIGLWRDGERVVFDANPGAIRATGIQVSARVLKLARLVETVGGVS